MYLSILLIELLLLLLLCSDSEYKVGYRKTMRKMRRGLESDDPNDIEAMKQLKSLVTKALEERRQEKLLQLRGKRRQRQASLTAVFRVGHSSSDLQKRLERLAQGAGM